jgi:hypothetical protein
MGETFHDCFLDVIRDNIESTLIWVYGARVGI